jgi:hypothetical protein
MTEATLPSGASTQQTQAAALIDLGLQACEAYERPDLAERLAAAKATLDDPGIYIVVVGDFKQGKSSMVNALLGTTICPVDDDIATALPTYVKYGEQPRAELLRHGDPPEREPLALDEVGPYVVADTGAAKSGARDERSDERDRQHGDGQPRGNGDAPAGVVVHLPRAMLSSGLVLVDTPGVGGLGSAHAAASLAAVAMADAVLFVTDASQELTAIEVEYLQRVRQSCSTAVCVVTKTDFYPAWRAIRDLDRGHLGDFPDMPVLPVSSTLRARAVRENDKELNAESGYPDLVKFVNDQVAGGATARLASSAAAEVVAVCQQIEAQYDSERAVLADPAMTQQILDELGRAKVKVESLRSAAAKWNQTLNDGITDLNSDVDYDLRGRIRKIIDDADELVDDFDPADTWHEVESWLEKSVSDEIVGNYAMLRERADKLSEQVFRHFQEASGDILDELAVYNPMDVVSQAEVEHRMDLDKMNVRKQAMTALKSSYMGILMFTMLGSMAGITLGPIAVGIGLAMGLGGLRAEKKRQRENRRAQARNAIRRYCDEVNFRVGKDSRDTLRRIQRQLRDHYSARAEELQRSTSQALQSASAAANRTKTDRDQRLADLDAELGRLRELRRRAEAVTS